MQSFNKPLEYQKKIKYTDKNSFIVDAYDSSTNTIYEYFGDFWHGNLQKYSPTDINPKNRKTFQQLYDESENKLKILKSLGFNIIYIWESDFKSNAVSRVFTNNLES